jgi:hypothetical protein
VELGDITAGALNVTAEGGATSELAGASIDVTGSTTLKAENGATYYGITLASDTDPVLATAASSEAEGPGWSTDKYRSGSSWGRPEFNPVPINQVS